MTVPLLLLPLLLACSPELGVPYDGEILTGVDMHLHSGEWDLVPPSTQEFLASNFPFPFSLDPEATAASTLSAEGIVEQLDRAGLQRGVLLAVYAPHSVGIATNELVASQVATYPDRLSGMASLRVDQWATESEQELATLDAALDEPGMIGVKLAHTHMHFRMDDPDYFGIYDVAAAHGAPVYTHTGPSPFPGTEPSPPYTDPAYLEAAITTYPEVDFILGHIGFDFLERDLGDLETCIELALAYPNVWLEPSAMGSASSDPTGEHMAWAMARFLEEDLVDRVIHGSDGPQFPGFVADYLERTLVAMESAGYSAEQAQAVLAGNFEALYGVSP